MDTGYIKVTTLSSNNKDLIKKMLEVKKTSKGVKK